MDDLRTRPRRESVGRSLGLLALLLLGTADAALARIDVSTTATRNGTVIQGTITLSNASSTAAGITSLRNTLEVSFDGGYVPPGLPVGSRSDYYVVATAFPTTPASVAGHGSVVIPFSIDVCDDGVASYPGSRAHDVRTVAVLTSPAGNDDAHSDAVSPPPNQSMCPVCGNGVREGDEQCDGGACCTAACTFAVDGASCSDGNACTQTDQCQSGSCVGGSPVTCAASDQCHAAGTCSPSTGACSNPARPNGTACNDGNACSTGDVCSGGVCGGQAMNCDDGNVCTTDSCSVGTCAHANNTAACDDGNACTTGDTCAAGACTSGGPRDCDDHRACTTDTCVAATGCAHAPTDVCDTCHAGDCTDCRGQCAAAESACSAGCWSGFLQCLAGCGNQTYCAPFCQVDFGQCANACPSAGAACDAACDTGNGCATECAPASADNDGDGVANGADNCPVTANPDQADRDGDGIGDACDPQTCGNGAREGTEACDGGSCCTAQCTTAPNGTTCDDGNACTRTDACQAGACAGSNPVVCAPSDQCHAAGACNPSTGTCSDPARPNGSACNDADVCTSGEVCGSGQCGGGAAVTCDDHEPCTTDACAAPGGCTHTPIAGCTCQAGACNACRAQCGTTGTCSSDCWSTFLGCLDGCTLTYCAAFCQADLGQCLGTCPPDDACLSDCDATNGCGSACTVSAPSTDRDGDAVADAADDCADMWNPGQADIDGDGTGDACDDSDATLATAQAVVRAGAGGLPKGRVTLKGTFGTTAAGDVFDASSAIAVTVTPGTGPTMEVAWPPAQCRARSATKITCAAPDRSASATFQAGKTGIWKFKVTMTGLVVASPTSPLVVDVRHGLGPIDRVGHLTVCTAPTSTMKCAMP